MPDGFTPEDLSERGIEALEEIIWEDTEPLRPGVDFHDGIVYFTVPTKIRVPVTVGRGKAATEKIEVRDSLVCVTSDRRAFPYNPETVAKLGFTYPKTVTFDDTRRWSIPSIKAFLADNTDSPDPVTLHAGIRRVYEEYVEFERGADDPMYDAMPLFVIGSYLFRLFGSLGYVHFNGTAASGKSQNLRLLDAMAFNTYWASSMSPAALYRQVAGMPGTVCIDEAESFEGERGTELRLILNAGYLDGSKVGRAEKGANDQFSVVKFESYGPKVLASINPLDSVIGSRCLIVRMRPAIRKIGEFDRHDERWQNLRDRLYLFAMYHTPAIARYVETWNKKTRFERAPQLQQRHWQITQLYVILADYIDSFDNGTRCDRLITFFNGYFADQQRAADATDRVRILLQCLPRVLQNNTPEDDVFYTLKQVHEEVVARLDTDATEYYKTRQVGRALEVLGFKNKRSRKGGTQVALPADQIRAEFRQRRVTPYEEDIAWLEGDDYTPPEKPTAAAAPDEIWWGETMEEEAA